MASKGLRVLLAFQIVREARVSVMIFEGVWLQLSGVYIRWVKREEEPFTERLVYTCMCIGSHL